MASLSQKAKNEANEIAERLDTFIASYGKRMNKNEQHDLKTGLDSLKRISD